MKILHILRDGTSGTSDSIIMEHRKLGHDVRVIDLQNNRPSYDEIVDAIFEYDRVISW